MAQVGIQWLGHSCMAVEESGFRIVFDPYKDGSVDGLGPLRTEADLVLCSHEHADHSGRECVAIRSGAGTRKNPFRITEIRSFHDDVRGAKRGPNTIRILDDGTYRIIHMGDIGCLPTREQMQALRGADVMMIPVGGFFTLEPDAIRHLVTELAPTVTIPMHYRGRDFGYPVIGTLEDYTGLCDDVVYYDRDTLYLPEDLKKQTAVLTLSR